MSTPVSEPGSKTGLARQRGHMRSCEGSQQSRFLGFRGLHGHSLALSALSLSRFFFLFLAGAHRSFLASSLSLLLSHGGADSSLLASCFPFLRTSLAKGIFLLMYSLKLKNAWWRGGAKTGTKNFFKRLGWSLFNLVRTAWSPVMCVHTRTHTVHA